MRTTFAFLVVADISGYTRFITERSLTLTHAEQVITDLIEAVLEQAQLPLVLNELEGDAALLFREIEAGDVAGARGACTTPGKDRRLRLLGLSAFVAFTCLSSPCASQSFINTRLRDIGGSNSSQLELPTRWNPHDAAAATGSSRVDRPGLWPGPRCEHPVRRQGGPVRSLLRRGARVRAGALPVVLPPDDPTQDGDRQHLLQPDANADLTGDGIVDFADLARMKSLFFQPFGASGRHP